MSKKKVVKLIDRRACSGGAVRELRQTIREIERGEIVSIGIFTVARDDCVRTYENSECLSRALGGTVLLQDHIRDRFK